MNALEETNESIEGKESMLQRQWRNLNQDTRKTTYEVGKSHLII